MLPQLPTYIYINYYTHKILCVLAGGCCALSTIVVGDIISARVAPGRNAIHNIMYIHYIHIVMTTAVDRDTRRRRGYPNYMCNVFISTYIIMIGVLVYSRVQLQLIYHSVLVVRARQLQ